MSKVYLPTQADETTLEAKSIGEDGSYWCNGASTDAVNGLVTTRKEVSTSKRGVTRLLCQVQVPVLVASTEATCCGQDNTTVRDMITVHAVITVPKKVMDGLVSPDNTISGSARKALGQAVGLGLGIIVPTLTFADDGTGSGISGFVVATKDAEAGAPAYADAATAADGKEVPFALSFEGASRIANRITNLLIGV